MKSNTSTIVTLKFGVVVRCNNHNDRQTNTKNLCTKTTRQTERGERTCERDWERQGRKTKFDQLCGISVSSLVIIFVYEKLGNRNKNWGNLGFPRIFCYWISLHFYIERCWSSSSQCIFNNQCNNSSSFCDIFAMFRLCVILFHCHMAHKWPQCPIIYYWMHLEISNFKLIRQNINYFFLSSLQLSFAIYIYLSDHITLQN